MDDSQWVELPSIVVVDDGELDDVRQLLDELGAEFVHWPKACVPVRARMPRRLLVTTPSHAISLGYARGGARRPDRPVWVCVMEGDLRQQRRKIVQSGFDFLVRRPVHPQALRLLLQSALYQGNEHRRGRRLAVGFSITYRSGWRRPQGATLVDLSPGGCRILTAQELPEGTRVGVRLPGHIAGGRAFWLKGSVARCRPGGVEGGSAGEFSIGIRLGKLSARDVKRLRELLQVLASGPPVLPEALAPPPPAAPTDGRRSPRGLYQERVLVFGDAERVLVARDLSLGGMRVDPTAALSEGEQVRLAVEGGPHIEPVVVRATVTRDDGERGLALRFDSVEEGGIERLEAIIRGLPAVEAPRDHAKAEEEPVVLTQLLPRVLRIPRPPR